jgi:ketosteroid isomerase-like protein
MRNFTLLTVLLLTSFANATAFADHHLSADKDAILKIEKEWAKALVEGDGTWFKTALRNDYKSVFPNGEVWSSDKFANAVTTGEINCSKCEILELDVRIVKDVAIVIAYFDVAGKSNGKDFVQKEKWTDVYVKDGEAWKCISSHGCKLTK